jgi:hypothetical protein
MYFSINSNFSAMNSLQITFVFRNFLRTPNYSGNQGIFEGRLSERICTFQMFVGALLDIATCQI